MKIFCFMTLLLMTLVSSRRLITVTAYEYQTQVYYNVNGAQMPVLTLERNEVYTFNVDTPSLTFCIQTMSGADYNLVQSENCIEDTLVWQVPSNAPDSLVYICKEFPHMNNTINIVDSVPYLHAWYNGKIIPPGGTLKYSSTSSSDEYLIIDLTNNGDGELQFLHHSILRKSSVDNGEALVGVLEPQHIVPPMATTSAKISFTGPFIGYIVFVTNDLQINYQINLVISPPEILNPGTESPGFSLFDTANPIPKAVNADTLVLYVVAPILSVMVACLTIGVMAVLLIRKDVPPADPSSEDHVTDSINQDKEGGMKHKDSESDLDVIQITDEEMSSEGGSVGEDMYSPEEDKFFRRNL